MMVQHTRIYCKLYKFGVPTRTLHNNLRLTTIYFTMQTSKYLIIV
jgi:hypothetical protein